MKDNSFKTIVVDDRKHYMVIPDCPIRLVYEENEYVGWYYAGDDAVEMLKNEEIRENPRKSEWIPVSERLPDTDGSYLVHKKLLGSTWCDVLSFAKDGRKVDEYDFHTKWKNVWYSYDSEWGHITTDSVTHWMPLPEPPKEAEQ